MAGWLAATIVAATAWSVGLIGTAGVPAVIAGAAIGTTFESYLLALAGSRLRPYNGWANFFNTVVGALAALALYSLMPRLEPL